MYSKTKTNEKWHYFIVNLSYTYIVIFRTQCAAVSTYRSLINEPPHRKSSPSSEITNILFLKTLYEYNTPVVDGLLSYLSYRQWVPSKGIPQGWSVSHRLFWNRCRLSRNCLCLVANAHFYDQSHPADYRAFSLQQRVLNCSWKQPLVGRWWTPSATSSTLSARWRWNRTVALWLLWWHDVVGEFVCCPGVPKSKDTFVFQCTYLL